MEITKRPQTNLAAKVLPKPLWKALKFIFAQDIEYAALVGGTALAGFYAGHRKSDDLDLFTRDEVSQKQTILASKSLKSIGASISDERQSPTYYRGLYSLDGHTFTIDVVLDENIHAVGDFHKTENKILVASLETIFMTKVATLISRCSEKDLYDLLWLFKNLTKTTMNDMLDMGRKIDAGVHGESILISLTGSILTETSCGFAEDFGVSAKEVFKEIKAFKSSVSKNLSQFMHNQSVDLPLANMLKALQ